jgi:hypothetical protein
MIWAVLALLGVPLWFCALGIGVLVFRSRALRQRPGNIPVRVLRPGKTRWIRGHAIWVSDVFAWRGSPAAWTELLVPVESVLMRTATAAERKQLHRLGDDPAVAVLTSTDGDTLSVATAAEHRKALQGPFAVERIT